jgi:hypothetical protein
MNLVLTPQLKPDVTGTPRDLSVQTRRMLRIGKAWMESARWNHAAPRLTLLEPRRDITPVFGNGLQGWAGEKMRGGGIGKAQAQKLDVRRRLLP